MESQDWKLIAKLEKAPVSYEDANRQIDAIGAARRELDRLKSWMNDEIAAIKAKYEADAAAPKQADEILTRFVRDYCKAHRAELTENGARKFHKFPAGEVAWRKKPPSIKASKKIVAAVIGWLHRNKLASFIRTKEELDKEALLKAQDVVERIGAEIPGVKYQQGGEQFEIKPIELPLNGGAKRDG